MRLGGNRRWVPLKGRRLGRGQRSPREVDVPLIDGELYVDQEDDNVI